MELSKALHLIGADDGVMLEKRNVCRLVKSPHLVIVHSKLLPNYLFGPGRSEMLCPNEHIKT